MNLWFSYEHQTKLRDRVQADPAFRELFKSNPKEALKQVTGLEAPDYFELKVVENTSDTLYLPVPANLDELDDNMLDGLSGGFIGGLLSAATSFITLGGGGGGGGGAQGCQGSQSCGSCGSCGGCGGSGGSQGSQASQASQGSQGCGAV